MTLPSFHAERAIALRRTALAPAFIAAGDPDAFLPARRSADQQDYFDCMVECGSSGAKNCQKTCANLHPKGTGSAPSTPPALEACCGIAFASCMADAVFGGVDGLVKVPVCVFNALNCTTASDSPCSSHFP